MQELPPTPERLEKGDITSVYIEDPICKSEQPCLRSSGAVYALQKKGTLSDAQVAAAEQWARDYETGILGARDPESSKQSGKPDHEYCMLSRIRAADRCLYIRERIGPLGEKFLTDLMVNGLSVQKISEKHGKRRERIAGAIDFCLEQLADLYADMPGKLWFNK